MLSCHIYNNWCCLAHHHLFAHYCCAGLTASQLRHLKLPILTSSSSSLLATMCLVIRAHLTSQPPNFQMYFLIHLGLSPSQRTLHYSWGNPCVLWIRLPICRQAGAGGLGIPKAWNFPYCEPAFRLEDPPSDRKCLLVYECLNAESDDIDPNDPEVVQFIKEIIANRIRPNVQEDGGDVRFLSFD